MNAPARFPPETGSEIAHAAANRVAEIFGRTKSPADFRAGQIALAKSTLARLRLNRARGAWRPLHCQRELAMAALALAAVYRRSAGRV
jgi:hypothetical protein